VAAPAYGTSGAWNGSLASTKSFAVPASVASGDIIVIPMMIDGSTVTISAMPSGFAHATNSPRTVAAGIGGNHSVNVVWKRASASDTGTYDFTFSSSTYVEGQAHRITGCVATGNPWDVTTAADGGNTGLSASPNVSLTTTGPDELLFFAATNWSGGAWTPPTGFSEITDNSGDLTADYKVQAVAGGTGNVSSTCAGTDKSGAWLGALIGTTVTGGGVTAGPLVVTTSRPAPRLLPTVVRYTLADPPVLTTTVPLVVSRPPLTVLGPVPILGRSSLADVVVTPTATTPAPIVVAQPSRPAPGALPITVRSTLQDPPVLTTPAPLVVTPAARPPVVAPTLFVRSSLIDLATPGPLVITPSPSPSRAAPALMARSSLIDLATTGPLVVANPAKPARIAPVLLSRSPLADVVVAGAATPQPMVITSPVVRPWAYRPVVLAGSLSQTCDCVTHRSTGATTTRPSAGTTTRPAAGVTSRPCNC
jgi:hypothetical protein